MVLLTPCSAAGGLFASDLPEIPGSQAAIEAFLEHDTAAAESLATAALNRYEPASLADSLACVDLILLQAKCRGVEHILGIWKGPVEFVKEVEGFLVSALPE